MPYPATKTYWLEQTGEVAWGLRRYRSSVDTDAECAPGEPYPYHRALVYLGVQPLVTSDDGYTKPLDMLDHADPRWPTQCERCGLAFTDDDQWQMWTERLWVTVEGQRYVLHQGAPAPDAPSAPPGAMWNAWWLLSMRQTALPDDIALMVRLPDGHDWFVDGEASNCTMKGDRNHQCWVRSGDPRTEPVTVSKAGPTCSAGAGSIASGKYHGFLQNGILTAG